jgi:gamma-glutamyltranspeptidase / glutathione hydrolase
MGVRLLLIVGCLVHGHGGEVLAQAGDLDRVARSSEGMVASADAHATRAGVEIFEAGGNAVDAAVATAFAIGVVDPGNSSILGRTNILIRTGSGEVIGIDGMNVVPASYPPILQGRWMEGGPSILEAVGAIKGTGEGYGYGTIAIPGTVAALGRALEEYGTMGLDEVLVPAIRLAREGFTLSESLAGSLARMVEDYGEFEGVRRTYLKPDGSSYGAGERFTNPDLANTLSQIAQGGTDALYRGEIGRQIVEDVQANGGFLTMEDLDGYEAIDAQIVRGSYRGYELIGSHPSPSSASTIEILQIMDRFDLAPLVGTWEWPAIVAQAIGLGLRDQLADLGTEEEKGRRQVSAELADARAGEIQLPSEGGPPVQVLELSSEQRGTTHLSVADTEGTLVSLTQSLGPGFGGGVITPGIGAAYAYTMGPRGYLRGDVAGGRITSRQSPIIVTQDGEPAFAIGASGSRRILSAIAQVLARAIDQGLELPEAMAVPRIHVEPADSRELFMQEGWSDDIRRALVEFGFEVTPTNSVAHVNAVQVDPTTGEFIGVSDFGAAAGPRP